YDEKPYVAYADSHPSARSGFVDRCEWSQLEVLVPAELEGCFAADEWQQLKEVLSWDPRPPYHDDPNREYGMPYAGRDVRFRVSGNCLTVVSVVQL
ncbi:MAG: tRNA (N6-threonylcarbamoyladenosine(37)-N6)-methyltransferase TrmO, partial [Prevotella sp.]|nr:tRNA (N6-threonylcarbamoyladenosine(37)-N6)-methyltransferase TrmO [Prevotella sp.]